MARSKLPEALPDRFTPCELCLRPGIVGVEVAPYYYGPKIKHKWHHRVCAEQYRAALVAAQRKQEAKGCKPAVAVGKKARMKSGVDMTTG